MTAHFLILVDPMRDRHYLRISKLFGVRHHADTRFSVAKRVNANIQTTSLVCQLFKHFPKFH